MVIPKEIKDLEFQKFTDDGFGDVAVRVVGVSGGVLGKVGITDGVDDATITPVGAKNGLDVNLVGGDIQIGAVEIKNATTDDRVTVDTNGDLHVKMINNLIPTQFDYISLSYTGADLTGVVYKTGGAGGTTVATLTLGYFGGNLVSVTRT